MDNLIILTGEAAYYFQSISNLGLKVFKKNIYIPNLFLGCQFHARNKLAFSLFLDRYLKTSTRADIFGVSKMENQIKYVPARSTTEQLQFTGGKFAYNFFCADYKHVHIRLQTSSVNIYQKIL